MRSHSLNRVGLFRCSLYKSWFASRIQCFKRCLIRKILSKAPKNCDKIKLIDRVLDGLVFALLVVKILDYLSVETGMAIGSIFAVGSTGTLIISLGSQEIAKGIVNGVEMASSDRFYEVSSTLAFDISLIIETWS
jgi:small-conductance mechanosensitive channel